MKKEYNVTITETLQMTIAVEAEKDVYKRQEQILKKCFLKQLIKFMPIFLIMSTNVMRKLNQYQLIRLLEILVLPKLMESCIIVKTAE